MRVDTRQFMKIRCGITFAVFVIFRVYCRSDHPVSSGTEVLLVSHGAPIAAIHQMLGGSWKYVGQATVSKFVQKPNGAYAKELSSDASHLSDKTNLRPW